MEYMYLLYQTKMLDLPQVFWRRFQEYLGTRSNIKTTYYSKIDGLSERMIRTIEKIITRLSAKLQRNLGRPLATT